MAGERILVVEDEQAVARGLIYGLEAEGFDTSWASTGAQAIEMAESRAPHVVLLDVRLPDASGMDVCRELRSTGFRAPIIMVTAVDDEVDKVLGLELGADDYVVKPYSLRELISRVRALLRRSYGELSADVSGDRLTFADIEVDASLIRVTKGGQVVDLTPTEFRLLLHLARHPEHPYDRSALIEAVWGYDDMIGSDRTVDVHVRHLRQKLEDDPADPRHIVTVRGVGYKFVP